MSYTRDELIREVEKESALGRLIVEADMEYLRSWKRRLNE